MKQPESWSRLLTMAGLLTVIGSVIVWFQELPQFSTSPGWRNLLLLAAMPSVILFGWAFPVQFHKQPEYSRRYRRWGEWVALFMVPYACIGVTDVVAGSGSSVTALALASSSVLTFFLALDTRRRSRY